MMVKVKKAIQSRAFRDTTVDGKHSEKVFYLFAFLCIEGGVYGWSHIESGVQLVLALVYR